MTIAADHATKTNRLTLDLCTSHLQPLLPRLWGKVRIMILQLLMPCYKPHPGYKLEVKTLRFALSFAIENLPGVRILMSNSIISPALRRHSKSNSPHFSPAIPTLLRRWRGWLQTTGARIETILSGSILNISLKCRQIV